MPNNLQIATMSFFSTASFASIAILSEATRSYPVVVHEYRGVNETIHSSRIVEVERENQAPHDIATGISITGLITSIASFGYSGYRAVIENRRVAEGTQENTVIGRPIEEGERVSGEVIGSTNFSVGIPPNTNPSQPRLGRDLENILHL